MACTFEPSGAATDAAFDGHASVYDRVWDEDPVAACFRREVHRILRHHLPAGGAVLDAGCGIGTDAAWLAAQGFAVTAIDASAGMVARARQRGVDARQLPVQRAAALGQRFDLVLLDFGVVNCLDPAGLGPVLAALLRPGGVVVIVSMPRLHPTWMLARAARGDLAGARARLRPVIEVPVGDGAVRTRYWSGPAIRRALGPAFTLVEQRSLGALMPPPGSRRGAALDRLERPLRGLPLVREVGDHVVVVLRWSGETPRLRPRRSPGRLRRRWERRRAQRTGELRSLRVLVLHLTDGCNSGCVACDFRGPAGGEALDAPAVARIAARARALGCGEVLLTGGEPLLRPDLAEVLAAVRLAGLRPTLLTNGLLLRRHAWLVARWCDEVVVSLDGHDAAAYRAARGVDGLPALRAGIAALRRQAPGIRLRARVTVTAANVGHLLYIARLARDLGLDGVSFLAADLSGSDAFGRRDDGGPPPADLLPDPDALRAELAGLRAALPPGFLTDSDVALDRIWQRAAADRGLQPATSPRCDAPWTSVVVQPDLSLRPCFFIPAEAAAAHARDDLVDGLFAMGRQLAAHDVATHPACQRCVCWARLG